jgi:hypothetical protein
MYCVLLLVELLEVDALPKLHCVGAVVIDKCRCPSFAEALVLRQDVADIDGPSCGRTGDYCVTV